MTNCGLYSDIAGWFSMLLLATVLAFRAEFQPVLPALVVVATATAEAAVAVITNFRKESSPAEPNIVESASFFHYPVLTATR